MCWLHPRVARIPTPFLIYDPEPPPRLSGKDATQQPGIPIFGILDLIAFLLEGLFFFFPPLPSQ
jgi:hypothetical protein